MTTPRDEAEVPRGQDDRPLRLIDVVPSIDELTARRIIDLLGLTGDTDAENATQAGDPDAA